MSSRSGRVVTTAFAVAAILSCSSNVASAEPPGFPDLGAFAEVSTDSYIVMGSRGMKSINFSTSEGVNCGFSAPPNPNGNNQLISCDGPLPGLQDIPIEGSGSGQCDVGTVNTLAIAHYKGACDSRPNRKILNPGQKVSYGNVTCAVGSDKLIACIERVGAGRGFVLQSSGSFVF